MIDWTEIIKPGAKLYKAPPDDVPVATITKVEPGGHCMNWVGPHHKPNMVGWCQTSSFRSMIRDRLRRGGRLITADGETLTYADLASQTDRLRDAIDEMDRAVAPLIIGGFSPTIEAAMRKLLEARPDGSIVSNCSPKESP